jgi:hypothetical protein
LSRRKTRIESNRIVGYKNEANVGVKLLYTWLFSLKYWCKSACQWHEECFEQKLSMITDKLNTIAFYGGITWKHNIVLEECITLLLLPFIHNLSNLHARTAFYCFHLVVFGLKHFLINTTFIKFPNPSLVNIQTCKWMIKTTIINGIVMMKL